jgi:hypothetical protein
MQTKDFVSLIYYLSENPDATMRTKKSDGSWMEIRHTPSGFISIALRDSAANAKIPQVLSTSPLVLKDHIWKKNEWYIETL